MRPILFWIHGIPIYSYGTSLAVAFAIGYILAVREGKEYGISSDDVLDLVIIVILLALTGARAGYILLEGIPFRDFFNTTEGGLSFHGGFLGGFIGGLIYCKVKGYSLWELADMVTPAIPLGYSIVRIGCLLNGCCYGIPTALPWAFPCSSVDDLPRHPTQIYSALSSLLLFFILWRLRKDPPFPGYLFFLYMGLYSLTRFFVEFFRESQYLFGWMKVAQFASLILAVISFGYLTHKKRRL